MTEKSCNYTGRYFVFLLGKLKTCIILSFIFSICGFPMAAAMNKVSIRTGALMGVLAVIGMGGIAIMSFVAPLITMKHLYTKTSADNILSLPLTAAQRFICEVSAAVLTYAVPFALTLPAVFIINSTLGRLAALCLAAMAAFTVFNIFLTGLCGRLAEAILYPLALNAVIPAFFYLALQLSRENVYGLEYPESFSVALIVLVGTTSPIGLLLCFGFFGLELTAKGYIAAAVFIAVFLALGYLVYIKRPVENIGQPFVYKKAFIINSVLIAGAVVVGTVSVLAGNKSVDAPNLAILAVMIFILLIIMEFINYKKIKSVVKFIIKYVGVFAAGLLISFGLYKSEGFGETSYIPAAEETDTVYAGATFVPSGRDVHSYDRVSVGLHIRADSELAEYVRAEQRRIIKERANDGSSALTVYYTLKNGKTVFRRYENCELPPDFTEKLMDSEEYRFSELTNLDRLIANGKRSEAEKESLALSIFGFNYCDEPTALRILDPYTNETIFDAEMDWETLRAALYTDLKNDAYYNRHSDPQVCSLYVGRYETWTSPPERGEHIELTEFIVVSGGIWRIYENYTETLKYLRSLGNVPTGEELLEKAAESTELLFLTRVKRREYSTDGDRYVQQPLFIRLKSKRVRPSG